MRGKHVKYLAYIMIMILVVMSAGCNKQPEKTATGDLTMEVALYPYVPDIERFQTVVSNAWAKEHPDVKLNFVDWDCYASDPDPTIDVFVFDGIYLSSFVDGGHLLPISEEMIQNKEDIFPFALEGCKYDDTLYAMPQLLCTDFLYTRKEDTELSDVTDITELYDILGDRKDQSVIPKENEGLLVNLSSGLMTKTLLYLDAVIDERQEYTDYSEFPETSDLSTNALAQINALGKMGGEKQVEYQTEDNDIYVRARWFAEGKGRAYIGYAEAIAIMGDYADDVTIRRFSYGTEKDIPLFYTDMVGISPKISEDKKELAIELANILISENVLIEMNAPAKEGDFPQYLLTSRKSVYDALGKDYPIYNILKENVDSTDNHVFRLGKNARQFLQDMEKTLSEQMVSDLGA